VLVLVRETSDEKPDGDGYMVDELTRLLARQQINDALMRYCRGVDRRDVESVRSAYHPDSFDDHGYWRGNGHDFASFVVDRLSRANVTTTHQVTNVLIEFAGDGALCESQIVATLVRRGTPVLVDVMGARYLDRLSERDGVWRIQKRTLVLDWRKTERWSEEEPPIPLDGFPRGGSIPDDPLYGFLGRRDQP
jgi:hypothetical protein